MGTIFASFYYVRKNILILTFLFALIGFETFKPSSNSILRLTPVSKSSEKLNRKRAPSSIGNESGYIQNIQSEKNQSFYEIFLYAPDIKEQKKLSEIIFNSELSKEFRLKYIEKFGSVDTESLIYRDARYAEFRSTTVDPATYAANNAKRKEFAEFMIKRLSEWHIDNYIKSEPQMKVIYDTKEKISHAQVAVSPQSKMDIQYSLSGNTLDLNYINPYMDSKLTVYMDPKSFGPADIKENRLFLGKQLNKTNRINLIVLDKDGVSTVEYIKVVFSNITTSLSSTNWFRPQGISPRDSRAAFGLGYSF